MYRKENLTRLKKMDSLAPEVMKAVVRANQNTAGIYGAVTRVGRLAVGQTILLRPAENPERRPTF